jgi:quercetin dioxygenase-like cupin family protein
MKDSLNALGTLVASDQGPILRAFGEEVRVLLTGEQTGGRQSLWFETTPPGGGPPPHYHTYEDETFFVLEGEVSFLQGGVWHPVGLGGVAHMPRGVIHTFKNTGERPLRMLISTAPAGFELFFARCADEFGRSGGPDMQRIVAISAEHGIHFVEP